MLFKKYLKILILVSMIRTLVLCGLIKAISREVFKGMAREDSTKDEQEHYPSNRDGIFGFVLQLADEQGQPSFIRHRGDAVYYFKRNGKDFIFSNILTPVQQNEKKLPPNITTAFKGPDGSYYFLREDAYCRRPLDLTGQGYEPPDYCPEGGAIQDLMGCNIHVYPPEVDDLCQTPSINSAFMAPGTQTVWLIRGNTTFLLDNLPTNPKGAPVKCTLSLKGETSKIWKKFVPENDAFFLLEGKNNKAQVVQFYKHRYTIWDFKGGDPLEEGVIKESGVEKFRIAIRKRKKVVKVKPNSRSKDLKSFLLKKKKE